MIGECALLLLSVETIERAVAQCVEKQSLLRAQLCRCKTRPRTLDWRTDVKEMQGLLHGEFVCGRNVCCNANTRTLFCVVIWKRGGLILGAHFEIQVRKMEEEFEN